MEGKYSKEINEQKESDKKQQSGGIQDCQTKPGLGKGDKSK